MIPQPLALPKEDNFGLKNCFPDKSCHLNTNHLPPLLEWPTYPKKRQNRSEAGNGNPAGQRRRSNNTRLCANDRRLPILSTDAERNSLSFAVVALNPPKDYHNQLGISIRNNTER